MVGSLDRGVENPMTVNHHGFVHVKCIYIDVIAQEVGELSIAWLLKYYNFVGYLSTGLSLGHYKRLMTSYKCWTFQ